MVGYEVEVVMKEDEEICGEEAYIINKKTRMEHMPYSEIFG
ncbi:MAG: hypothetical protein AABX74_05470 [Nanoarchaeota archaeon]